jgi:hypothetical protein
LYIRKIKPYLDIGDGPAVNAPDKPGIGAYIQNDLPVPFGNRTPG